MDNQHENTNMGMGMTWARMDNRQQKTENRKQTKHKIYF